MVGQVIAADAVASDFLSDTDWRPTRLWLPRFSFYVSRMGMRRRILWPGRYQVRRSRTLRVKLFRRA